MASQTLGDAMIPRYLRSAPHPAIIDAIMTSAETHYRRIVGDQAVLPVKKPADRRGNDL